MKQILILTFLLLPLVLHAQSGWRYIGPEAREVHTMSIQGDLIFTSVIIPGVGGAYATLRLYRSTDAGRFWEEINPEGFLQSAIATVLPDDSGRVFAYLNPRGKTFFLSSDTGKSWDSLVVPFSVETLVRTYTKQGTPGLVFMLGESFYSRDRLFRSSDYGRTWIEPYPFPASSDGADLAIGISPTSDDIYVSDYTNIGGSFLFHSSDLGVTWTYLGFSPFITHLIVDQVDSRILYAISAGNVIRSTDGGASWNVIFQRSFEQYCATVIQARDSPDELILLTQRSKPGVHFSYNSGQQWLYDSTSVNLPYKENFSPFDQISWLQYEPGKKRLYLKTDSGIYMRELGLTGIRNDIEEENPMILSIYPQPAHDFLRFSLSNPDQRNARLKIYSTLGEVVHVITNWDGRTHTWYLVGSDEQKLPGGVYFLVVESRGEVNRRKVIIQR